MLTAYSLQLTAYSLQLTAYSLQLTANSMEPELPSLPTDLASLPTADSFLASEPFFTATVTDLPFSQTTQTLTGVVVIGVAILLSLAVVYHWLTYSRHPLMAFVTLGAYAVGFFFFAGLIVASGVF